MSNDKEIIKFFSFEKFHNRKNIGSTQIRVNNLIKYWPEASCYKYGEKMDTLILQKVYIQPDFDWIEHLKCIKILDICDPDWLDEMPVKRTIDACDAVVVPTKELADFIKQMTFKPVRIIKDRFDLSLYPRLKTHTGRGKKVVWFGYHHNAKKLKGAVHAIRQLGLSLTIIADKEPNFLHWPESQGFDKKKYKFVKYAPATVNEIIARHDVAILPQGYEPRDRFKSENKDIKANLCGVPVAKTREELEALLEPEFRNQEAKAKYDYAIKNYDCIISVSEYQDLISELETWRKRGRD